MILSVFAGCGGSESGNNESTDTSATEGTPSDETEFVQTVLSADDLDPRKVVYDYMYKMSQIKWTPSELLDLSSINEQLVYTPGTEYVGMPYVTQIAGTYEMFMDVLEDGKYVGPTDPKNAIGNHCSSSIINSWKQVSNTITAGYTVNMMPNKGKGTIPVGDYVYEKDDQSTEDIVHHNKQDVIFEAYTKLQLGDAILSAVREALLSGETQLIWTEIAGDVRMPDFEQVYRDVNVPSQDAHFDEAWNVVPEVVGCSFEVSEAERLWREARPGTRIEIPLELFEPEVKAADLEGLLYRDRLCFMTTNYWDSDADRIGNIHLAADSLNGIVILPGEVFSYNDAVGERTEERGYRWAGAYADGEVTTEIGGGICQVSSTLYCAAMYAQMTTTMRQNHWFPVSYLSMGYDATVSWGGPDYRFKNTRDYPVKLNVYYDDHSVTIEFWGTNVDGSHVSPWTTSNEVYDEQWGCLIGYSVTVIRNILDADDNLITQIQEPTGIYHLHDHEIDWPEEKLRQDAAGQ